MDTSEFIKIAIAAAIAQIVKELISWLSTKFRTATKSSTIKTMLRKIFNKNFFNLMISLVLGSILVFAEWDIVVKSEPITRIDSFIISLFLFGIILAARDIIRSVLAYIEAWQTNFS